MIHDNCEGCRHDLGGGCCRINEEAECGAGDRELWEEKEAGNQRRMLHQPRPFPR